MLDQLEQEVHLEMTGIMEHLGMLDQEVHLELQVLEEIKEHKDNQEPKEAMEIQVWSDQDVRILDAKADE